MKQIKKMIIYITLMLVILSTDKVYAEEIETKITVLEETQIPLYDSSNSIVAYHFTLSNGGYIITNSDGTDFIEYSLEKQEDILKKSNKYYYSGPCSVYKKENNNIVENCYTNEKLQLSAIDFEIEPTDNCNKDAAFDLADEIISVDKSNISVIEEGKLLHSTKSYRYNHADGRCGAVAAAILLRYYDDYVDTKYVKGSYKTANGEKLIDLLVDKYVGVKTDYTKMISGLNKYLSNMKITSKFYKTMGENSIKVYSVIKSYIKRNRPLIVGLTGHPKYTEHWVVGTGFYTLSTGLSGNSYVVVVNDGWGNTGIRINNVYIDGCIYIN